MDNRELHVPRYRGMTVGTMSLCVLEEDHDRVVALLTAENERLKVERDAIELNLHKVDRAFLSQQAELTKARECIADLYKCGQKQDWVSRYPSEFARAKNFLAHQSALTAKGE